MNTLILHWPIISTLTITPGYKTGIRRMGADMFERLRELREHKRRYKKALQTFGMVGLNRSAALDWLINAEAHRTAYNMKKYWFMRAL